MRHSWARSDREKVSGRPIAIVEPGRGGSSALRPRAHLVDELEAVLVGHTLVGELDGVEREGGGRVERDDAGSEDSRDLSSQRGKEFVSKQLRGFFPDIVRGGSASRRGPERRARRADEVFSMWSSPAEPNAPQTRLANPARALIRSLPARVLLISATRADVKIRVKSHLGVVSRGRLDDDGRAGRLGADLSLGNDGLAGEGGGGKSSHFDGRRGGEADWFGCRNGARWRATTDEIAPNRSMLAGRKFQPMSDQLSRFRTRTSLFLTDRLSVNL